MSDTQVQSITTRCPGLGTSCGMEVANGAMAFFCGEGLDLSIGQMRRLVLRAPGILELSVEEKLVPQAARWLQRADIGLSRKQLAKLALTCPQVFLLDYDEVFAPIVSWLMAEVQLPRNRIAKVLIAGPSLLTADLTADMKPRHRWMIDVLELDVKEASRLLALSTDVLHVSFEETLSPACSWLRRVIKCDMAGVGQVVIKAPELLTTDLRVLDARLHEMSEVLFEGDIKFAADALISQPLLVLQSNRLRPLIAMLTGELGATLPEARELMISDPSILAFQLERRVLPRLEAIRKNNVRPTAVREKIDRKVTGDGEGVLSIVEKMRILGKFSDARFAKWLGRSSVRTSPRNDVAFTPTG